MKFKIPKPVNRALDWWEELVNIPIGRVRGFELVWNDVLLALGFVACAGYYGYYAGVRGVLFAAGAYILSIFTVIYVIRRD